MTAAWLALAVLLAIGAAVGALAAPHDRRAMLAWALVSALPLGVGVTSCLFFLMRLGADPNRWALAAVEIPLLAVLAWLVDRRRRVTPSVIRGGPWDRQTVLSAVGPVLLAAALVIAVALGIHVAGLAPNGMWDAWAIWNMRARFLVADGGFWMAGFDPEMPVTDYPLLLPTAVARLWTYAGSPSAGVASMLSLAIGAWLPAATALVVGSRRGPTVGAIAGLLVLTSDTIVVHFAYQYADLLVALFLVVGGGALALRPEGPSGRGLVFLGGLSLGLAAFTKNEGVVALGVIGAAWLVHEASAHGVRRAGSSALALCAGAALPVLALLWFKARLAPPNYLFSLSTEGSVAAKLADPGRYRTVLAAAARGWWDMGGGAVLALPVTVAVVGAAPRELRRGAWLPLAVFALFAAELGVYLVTPFPLEWQLANSLDRLVLQAWPALVAGSLLCTGGEPLAGCGTKRTD